jgi:hypothetical protein
MKNRHRLTVLVPALGLALAIAAPTAEAGGYFGIHLGSSGFGVSVGVGDWGPYTQSWADPYWSLDFNTTLAGYGEWVWVSGLGRVWRPWVAVGWRPYTHGRWVTTTMGWTWVSYEPWGYAPHHYGSWAYSSFGWVWAPGYTYSCANVVWVRAGGYVGWYARPPHGWSHAAHGFHRGYRQGYHNGYGDGYRDGWHDARYATYVDWHHFGAENVSHHAVNHSKASKSRIEDHAASPTSSEVRRRGGAPVTEARLSQRTVKMGGREVTIARPEGVAHSIERNAAETVGSTLSEKALERRQPLVRTQAASAAGDHGVSRPGRAAPETRSSVTERRTQPSSQHRIDRSGFSARSSFDRGTTAESATKAAPVSTSRFGSRRERDAEHGYRGPTVSSPSARPSTDSRSLGAPVGSYRSRSARTEKAAASKGTSSSLRRRVERTQSSRSTRKAVPHVQPSTNPRRPGIRADKPDSSQAKQSTSARSSSRRTRRR